MRLCVPEGIGNNLGDSNRIDMEESCSALKHFQFSPGNTTASRWSNLNHCCQGQKSFHGTSVYLVCRATPGWDRCGPVDGYEFRSFDYCP